MTLLFYIGLAAAETQEHRQVLGCVVWVFLFVVLPLTLG
jgi:cytochrome c1